MIKLSHGKRTILMHRLSYQHSKALLKKRKKREEETLLLALVIQSGTSILE